MAPTYKLMYYNAPGIAEPIRYLLCYGGIDFEDFRFGRDGMADLKPKLPFGQVPVLEIDGKQAYQSLAICRYLAHQFKLCGADAWENMEIDSIVDTINDFRIKMFMYYYEPNPEVKEKNKGPLFAETVPYYLGRFEKIAEANNGHLAVGKLTWADFYFTALLDNLNPYFGKPVVEGYPNLERVSKNVTSLPAIKDWIEKHPPK
ncbi:hypothetical protein FQA39_LY05493 [Lamprigera yunnana]|nr:hypothetical protein FQA39_LY05493 [Lamprigera yunnana]